MFHDETIVLLNWAKIRLKSNIDMVTLTDFEEFVIVHICSYLIICKISVLQGILNLSKDVTGNSFRLGTP